MKRFYLVGFIFLLVVFFAVIAGFFYFFVIPPKVISISPLDRSSNVSINSPIIIRFDKPVERQKINYTSIPKVYGEWKFEDSLIKNHLFRTLVFVPAVGLEPNTKYYVKLDNISTPLNIGTDSQFLFTFVTKSSDNNLTNAENGRKIIANFIETLFAVKPVKTPSSDIKLADAQNIAAPEVKGETITKLIEVPFDWQDYPLSCEAASLKMGLAAKGVNVSEDNIMQKIGYDATAHVGNTWGNPYNAFVGSISGSMCTTGYGVYWEPVAKAASYWRPAEYFSNWDIKQLTNEISLGNPVIFWGVIPTGKLTDCSWSTPGGEQIKAFKEDHVRLVVGFIGSPENPTKIIIKDPLNGDLYWPTSKFLTNWEIYDNSGVVIR